MKCPKCGASTSDRALECSRCGIIFSRWQPREPVRSTDRFEPAEFVQRMGEADDLAEDGRVGMSEVKILAGGLVAAILIYLIPFTRFVLSAMVTLFHELGHAVAGWLLGYPSLPAFDFVYGGGFTHYGAFNLPLAIAIGAIFLYAAWHFRENRKSMAIILSIFALWLVAISSEWRRELVSASAGHIFEFILAAVLLYQALSGVGWRIPEIERPLGAFVGFFVQIHSTHFAWRLIKDPDFLAWYRQGKGGALMNDLEVVALDLQIYVGPAPGIQGVAKMLLIFSLLPIAVALLWFFKRRTWHRVLRSLRTAEA
jgi:hypothetical protein